LSGISALLVYGIIVFTSLGFTSTKSALYLPCCRISYIIPDYVVSYFLNALGGSIQLLAGLFPMLYIDRLGRRTILLFGVLIAEIGLILLSGLFNRWPQADNHGAAVVCVMAIYFVFIGEDLKD
jgi:succinate-acetate transporter protein